MLIFLKWVFRLYQPSFLSSQFSSTYFFSFLSGFFFLFFFFWALFWKFMKPVLRFQDITCSKFSSWQSLKIIYKELWNQVTPLTASGVLNEINVKTSDEFVAHSKYSINIYLNHLQINTPNLQNSILCLFSSSFWFLYSCSPYSWLILYVFVQI